MKAVIFIIMIVAMFCALGALVLGILSMASGKKLSDKYGNKLMQLRIFFQLLAIGLFVIFLILGWQA